MLAFLLLICEPGTEKELIGNLQNHREFSEMFVVYGEYDIIGKVEVPDLKRLNELIFEVRQHRNIRMTRTLIAFGV